MNRTAIGVLILAPFFTWVGASIAVDASRQQPDVRDHYRRPAQIPTPDDNPPSPAKVNLGRTLFFDPILSGSGVRSCATCHNPGLSWGDGLARARGEGPAPLALRSPTLLAIAWIDRLGWDGKFPDLESVSFAPLLSPNNMHMTEPELIARLSAIPGYVKAFGEAFGDGKITRRNIELALAAFERTIVPGPSPFERWINGDDKAIDAAARRGFALFNGKAQCSACHKGFAFTDGSFHDIGTAKGNDIGRGRLFPKSTQLRYAFKTPTLWDVARRAPYMHDGSVPTLDAVIDLYDRGGIDRPSRSPHIRPLHLTAGEKADLIAFLHTLTTEPERFVYPALPR
jgi:cytochrome c peroxidase